jgi:hypothetical protein
MSHDLYFTKPRITKDQFAEYFRSRQNYEVSDQQAIYQNEDTGVYFVIDYNEPCDSDPEAIASSATLNLNYYRPHVFALEAVGEIASFIDHFGFSIHDPQNEGMGDGPFSTDGFLKSWNHGNEFGYSAILRGENAPDKVWTLPSSRLESIWRWNLNKSSVQDSFAEDRFVPRIFFMVIQGRVASVAVWPDAISELVPEADFLIIGRDELAPKSLFVGKKKDQILVSFAQVQGHLAAYETGEFSVPSYKLPAPQVPETLRKFIRDMKHTGITGEVIPCDQVLNEEIVAKTKKG